MTNKIGLLLCLFISLFSVAQQKQPKLIVGIVVDQMRDEYIDRFYNDFGENGFKRLVNNGYRFKNMHFNYMPTYTGPGHASVFTGAIPANHSIVGNTYYNKQTKKSMYCADDDSVALLGDGKEDEGKMSPKNLTASTITDEVKLATNFKGKVIGMSIKDRGAILPAGHFADWAFWLSDKVNFISSTFYGKELPKWVESFNNKKTYLKNIKKGWHLLKDPSVYNESLPDKNPYESKLNYTIDAVFPYDLQSEYEKSGPEFIKATPFGNDLLLDFAKAAIESESLGKDNITDFLTVSFSSTDYIGHAMGPRSIEIQDTYLRLDENIADLLKFLDKKVGAGNYLIFLTADHACGENPNFLNDHKYHVHNLSSKDMRKDLEEFSKQTYQVNLIENYSNQNIFFNQDLIAERELYLDDVLKKFQNFLQQKPQVKRAFTEKEILASSNNFLMNLIANGYNPKLNGQMVVLYEPAYMEYGPVGTTHGTPYGYDTHVPGLFYGFGIPKGTSYKKHFVTEIAPTISSLLHITFPNASENKVLLEVLKK